MKRQDFRNIPYILLIGLITGLFMVAFFCLFAPALPIIIDNFLNAPAIGLAWWWYEVGLPPQGEAALAMPLVFGFIQWFIIGALFGLWRCRKVHRSYAQGASKKADSEIKRLV
ncbi:MAG: hypothetical protein M1608_15955 [Candidatus Omnitrophica bacterium]|nr:hypothetical protein [Candidatus Omnitrophota bacterium]